MQKLIAAAAASTLVVGGLAACGGGSSSKSSKQIQNSTVDLSKKGVRGGTLTALGADDVDHMDPGQTYYQAGYAISNPTQRTLYYIKPGGKGKASPDLATGMPQIAPDNKSFTVKIRPDVKFAPPVNRTVTTADVKYAFERAFTKQVPNGYVSIYFNDIVGAPAKPGTGDYKPISGITTPDKTTIKFAFSKPVAGYVSQALVLPITAPVPKEYAQPLDESTPTKYENRVVASGPYMVQNDSSGRLTGFQSGKQIVLVRNPNWDPKTDIRPAYLDKFVVKDGYDDEALAARKALTGRSLYSSFDGANVPAQILKRYQRRIPKQLPAVDSGGGHWVGVNNTIKPLDNLNFRKALIAITNRFAQRQLNGGPILGELMTGIIVPGLPGFKEAGGLNQSKGLDWMANPKGDPAVAKKYMLLAKKDGVPVDANGKYTGKALDLYASNTPDQARFAQLYKSDWAKIGLKTNIKQVPQSSIYTRFCGRPKAKVPLCTSVGWGRDFADAQTMMDPTFNGRNIIPQGNVNYSQLNDPAINELLDKGPTVKLGPQRNQYFAKINRMIMETATVIPLTWDFNIQATSKNVVPIENEVSGSPDVSWTYLQNGGK